MKSVHLHCGPVVDFTTLHPFDFDRNLFNFLIYDFIIKTEFCCIESVMASLFNSVLHELGVFSAVA